MPEESFYNKTPKNGRPLDYETPELLKGCCDEYFEYQGSRVIEEQHWVGKEAHEVSKKHRPPFTLMGLCVFLGITLETWSNYRKREHFLGVCTHVEQIIYVQKFERASVGMYNANIIGRELGLMREDHKPPETNDKPILENGDKLPEDE